ncbi:vWA domain-containing protein [Streptomyces sp. CBMA152]|uniref:vWA domain-containing protein n=1 Tax=Streptomyces sp. CBMA152 TaxID=1896312 RepID=UPI00166034F6|nr:vWA domain-containing protein [Streptomyces sp. CBMA152]
MPLRRGTNPSVPSAPDPRAPALTRPAAVTSGLSLTLYQNEYLAPGATEAHAIVTMTGADAAPHTTSAAPNTLVFLLGLSTRLPEADFRAVTRTVATAVDGLDEGISFAVVAGSEYARMLYPDTMRLVRASTTTKAEARAALARLEPVEDAAFGRWIRLADQLFAAHTGAVRTAVLLTDLTARAEDDDERTAALSACAGRFTCHIRGIGDDWSVAQLTSISSALGGSSDTALTPPSLGPQLTSLIDRTRQTLPHDLALRITTPDGTRVRFLKQIAPAVEDLSGRGHPLGPHIVEYPVGLQDGASHDYHLCLDLPPLRTGGELTAAELDIVLLPPAGDGQTLTRLRMPVRCEDPNTP